MSKPDEAVADVAWEDLRCPECGNVEHSEGCSNYVAPKGSPADPSPEQAGE